jgi:hypothetical protein
MAVTFASAPPALLTLIPSFLITEYPESIHIYKKHRTNVAAVMEHTYDAKIVPILLLLGVAAFLYNVSTWFAIEYTSAHYFVLVGNMKG